jgi:hypothetical protein
VLESEVLHRYSGFMQDFLTHNFAFEQEQIHHMKREPERNDRLLLETVDVSYRTLLGFS